MKQKDYLLYCPKCKQETLIDAESLVVSPYNKSTK